jgi:hypothetical protein
LAGAGGGGAKAGFGVGAAFVAGEAVIAAATGGGAGGAAGAAGAGRGGSAVVVICAVAVGGGAIAAEAFDSAPFHSGAARSATSSDTVFSWCGCVPPWMTRTQLQRRPSALATCGDAASGVGVRLFLARGKVAIAPALATGPRGITAARNCERGANTPGNPAGRRVLEHAAQGRRVHLFVKPGSHDLAVYLDTVTVQGHTGSGPMSVTLGLSRDVPMEVFAELTG